MTRVDIATEMHPGSPDELWHGDMLALLPRLREAYAGQASLVYIDPPFLTGKRFEHRRAGVDGPSRLAAYDDRWTDRDYYAFMRDAVEGLRALLSDAGSMFVHVDYRTSARLRLLLDDVFGAENFVNEIIWAYESGGRARRHFSRKHDTILYYRASKRAPFYPDAVGVPRELARANHMKRGVDEDGRAYRSIRSAGKEYRYYDDDLVPPGDVWDDISHLQQRDPERTGYETQKPLKLLDRIVRCATLPGDLVIDACCGSGTTLDAARRAGRRFVGVDVGDVAVAVCRERLCAGGLVVRHAAGERAREADVAFGIASEQQDGVWRARLCAEAAVVHGKEASARGTDVPSADEAMLRPEEASTRGTDAPRADEAMLRPEAAAGHIREETQDAVAQTESDASHEPPPDPWYWAIGERIGDAFIVRARSFGPLLAPTLSMPLPREGVACAHIVVGEGRSAFFDM